MTVDDSETAEDQPPTDRDGYGFPRGLWRGLADHPPPGAKAVQRWRSPLRGLWLTSVLGSVLLVALPIVIITGLLSYIAYGPQFGQAIPGDVGWLKLPTFDWPASPAWIYRLNQGLHVGLGLILIPVVLAKLWSVIPRLFAWPPSRSIAQVLERVSLLMLVGGILFEIITGVLNIQYDYIFGFSFYTAHYYGAWVFITGFVVHIAIKIPRMWTGLRSRSMREVLRTNRTDTIAEPYEPDGLVAENPTAATISRRGALALVGGGALFVALITAGQTVGGVTRKAALLLPRGRTRGDGPNDFQVNRTAWAAGITPEATGGRLAPHPDRWPVAESTRSGCAERDASAHRAAADRVRRGLVDNRDLDRCAVARPGATGRCSQSGVGVRPFRGAAGWLQSRHPAGQSGDSPRLAACAAGQRRGLVTRSRLSGAHHRPGPAWCAQHQVGHRHRFPGGLRCLRQWLDSAPCTAPTRCTS